jgi:hypothetical protein
MTAFRLTGGCQCGAVRYALHEPPTNPHICHCRMCQKAFGSFFAPLFHVSVASFEITRGALAMFKSSDIAERGFCRACGTPLTVQDANDADICVSIGSLDEPTSVVPAYQYGVEGRLPYFAALAGLPDSKTTEEDMPEKAAAIARTNHQHPDHDTAVWPPNGGSPR